MLLPTASKQILEQSGYLINWLKKTGAMKGFVQPHFYPSRTV